MYPAQELGRKEGGGRIFEGGVLAGHYTALRYYEKASIAA